MGTRRLKGLTPLKSPLDVPQVGFVWPVSDTLFYDGFVKNVLAHNVFKYIYGIGINVGHCKVKQSPKKMITFQFL